MNISGTQNESKTIITVQDSGPGIPKEKQSLIFNRFERVERTDSSVSMSGLGLGLYICKQITEALGGRIELQSEKGKGTSFFLELPNTIDN